MSSHGCQWLSPPCTTAPRSKSSVLVSTAGPNAPALNGRTTAFISVSLFVDCPSQTPPTYTTSSRPPSAPGRQSVAAGQPGFGMAYEATGAVAVGTVASYT